VGAICAIWIPKAMCSPQPGLDGSVLVKPELRRLGKSQSPVVVIDDFSGDPDRLIEIAAALAPFPSVERGYYPGLRRIITEADPAAYAYVERALTDCAQFIAGSFDVDGFDLLGASFSMITTDPAELKPQQRAPHFDTTDPKYYAVLHYLNVPTDSGTAFYRQRSTGIERVTDANVDIFVRVAQREMATLPTDSGYILGSNPHYEQIGAFEAVPDRLIIYQGSLLHSGIIPPGMNRSPNPHQGRLTANIFVRGH
jgi:hypothetical protein